MDNSSRFQEWKQKKAEQKIQDILDGQPTLEKAVLVLEAAGFRVFDITYYPERPHVGQSASEALKAGLGVAKLSITPGRRPETAPTLAEEALHE
jgi:hypothetical protein